MKHSIRRACFWVISPESNRALIPLAPEGYPPVKPIRTVAPARLIKEDIDVNPVTSWKENRWIFEQQSLAQIAVDLERKFDVRIIFESEKLKSYRFTGTILAEPIEQVLIALSMTAPINYNVRGRVVTLSENKDFIEINKNLYIKNH